MSAAPAPGEIAEPSPGPLGGIALVAAAALALIVANSRFGDAYVAALHAVVAGLSLIQWVNNGLMAVFFLVVGLEVKRELLAGSLTSWPSRILPGSAAIAGMAIPALIYIVLTRGDAVAPRGWAIPAATDIAFALGVLALLGSRIPPSLRVFLAAVAIIDDLGAIVVIGVFYTAGIDFGALALGVGAIALLAGFNRAGLTALSPYLLVGAVAWFFVQRSGVHATLAGVALAFTIPLRGRGVSPLVRLEHILAPIVAFVIVPVFAFANAGIVVHADVLDELLSPIPLAIVVALVVGKQIGVFGAVWGLARWRLATPPPGATWRQVYGVALLCGIGFTMSLFIAALAFGEGSPVNAMAKLGVLAGSLLSATAGILVLGKGRKWGASAT